MGRIHLKRHKAVKNLKCRKFNDVWLRKYHKKFSYKINASRLRARNRSKNKKPNIPRLKSILVSEETYLAFKKYSESYHITDEIMLAGLLEFYELKHLDLLLKKLKTRYDNGLTLIDISWYSCIYTLMGELSKVINL